ncbi:MULTISPECIES: response regulator [Sphingomonas]|jgi:CheY-like chemotaxis protein|uniref:response regulator n=1 Tax=Sphingomonas TaxID=13687 RepID=UPI00193C09D1|nr:MULTISPECIES: response regulator [Sphingomonas]
MSLPSPLAGKHILVVEDEYLIADDFARVLTGAGAQVVGPAASLPQGMRLVGDAQALDAAVLDINLRETMVYPLIDRLIGDGVRVLLTSGYDETVIPAAYHHLPRYEKPVSAPRLLRATEELLADDRS